MDTERRSKEGVDTERGYKERILTLCTARGELKSIPPDIRKPHGICALMRLRLRLTLACGAEDISRSVVPSLCATPFHSALALLS